MNLSFNTSPKMLLCIAAMILAVLLFCAFKVNTNPSGVALTGFIFSCVALAVLALYTKIDVVIQVLRDDLEPKTGGTLGPNVAGVQRDHRNDLEYSLVHALAPHLVNTKNADELGTFIRDVVNSIQGHSQKWGMAALSESVEAYQASQHKHLDAAKQGLQSSVQRTAAAWEGITNIAGAGPHKCLVHGVAACACSQAADDLAHSAGFQLDQRAEAEIVEAGLTAPRVTAEQIQALMEKLIWVYDQPEGTTSTFAHAYLGRFYLATGHSACVSPENFNAALGVKYAREQGEVKVRDKLWELEGYKLHSAIAGQ